MSSKFGDYLRAGRLGYGYVKALDLFVRITGPYLPQASFDEGRYAQVKGPWLIDVALHAVDMKPITNEQHRCWWEHDKEGTRLLEVCPALVSWLDRPKRYYWVDEDGKEIESG